MSWIHSAQADLLARYMDLAAKRQSLITSNIANVDTPGYKTQGFDFAGEFSRAIGTSSSSQTAVNVSDVDGLTARPDGNNVSIDREGLLLSEVQLQFGIAEQLLKSQFKNLQMAITEGGTSA